MASPPLKSEKPTFGMRMFAFQRKFAPYLFIAPFFILFFIFGLFPMLFSMYLSFQSWNPIQGLGAMEFVGFENYAWVFTDPDFYKSLYNTLYIGITSGIAQHLVAIPLAFILVHSLKQLRHPFTAAYFVPFITSTVAIAIVFNTFFGTQYGILNQGIMAFSNSAPVEFLRTSSWGSWLVFWVPDEPIRWLGRARNIKPALAILVFWKYFGWNTVLYSAGLATIPKEYYDAAAIDGANFFQRFRHISLPLLRPIMFFAISLTIIGSMQLFDEPFILAGNNPMGGIDNAGMTVAMYLYREGFSYNQMGSAAATSWILFVVIGIMTAIQFALTGREGLDMLMTHTATDIFSAPPPLWFGDNFLSNYNALLEAIPMWRNMLNSIGIGLVATFTTLVFCSLGGYALAMYDFRYKNVLFGFILSTFLIPPILNLIPFALIVRFFNWFNHPLYLALFFMMRQFFASSMSTVVMDAARVDGASEFRTFWSVALPLVRPGLATLGLLTFIGSWNNFLFPLVAMNKRELFTIPLALRSIQGTADTIDWGAVIFGTAFAVTPLLIIFFMASRQIIAGITQGSVKG